MEELIKRLRYDSKTGKVYWIDGVRKDKEAGTVKNKYGYRAIQLGERKYATHRVIWYMHHGDPGSLEVDHINRDVSDNRIENLRLVPREVNKQNRSGLCIQPTLYNKWQGSFKHKHKRIHVGNFDCPLLAGLAVKERKLELGIPSP